MAQVFTSSVPTQTVFATSTSLLQATVTQTSLSVGTSLATSTVISTTPAVGPGEADVIGTEVQIIESLFTSTSLVLSATTATSLISTPMATLYALSLSTSTVPSTTQSITATLALSRRPLGSSSTPGTTTSDNGVVVVTQYTTVTPTAVLSATTSSGAASGVAANAANGTSSSASPMNLSSGAIAGIAVGGLAAAAILALLAVMLCRRRRHKEGKRESMYGLSGPNEKLASTDVFNPSFVALPASGPGNGSGSSAEAGVAAMAGAAGAGTAAARRSQRGAPGQSGRSIPPPVSNLAYDTPSNGQESSSSRRSLPPLPNRESVGAGSPSMYLATRQPGSRHLQVPSQQRTRSSVPAPARPVPKPEPTVTRAASMASIPSGLLGKGSGYASPMAPMDHLGKPIDQKTWRERQSFIANGISPDVPLTSEQKMRRDSQLAKLQAGRNSTASAAPGLSSQREVLEPGSSSTSLPLASVAAGPSNRRSSQAPASSSRPTAPHPSSIIPSFPPTSSHCATPTAPAHQPSYQLYQPSSSAATPPIRASFLGPSQLSSPGIPAQRQSQGPFSNGDVHQQYRTGAFGGSSYTPQLPNLYEQSSASESGLPRTMSIADDIYGGLTSGLSDRDITRLSMAPPQNGRR